MRPHTIPGAGNREEPGPRTSRASVARENFADGQLGELRHVHFVWAVADANGARVGEDFGQRGVLTQAGTTVGLHGAIDYFLAHARHRYLDHRDGVAGSLVALAIEAIGRPPGQQPCLLNRAARALSCRMLDCSDNLRPKATRESMRAHMSCSARSAPPIRRMQ